MSTPILQRKFSWLTSAVVVALACLFIFMAADPLTDWIGFDWWAAFAVAGGIALFGGVVIAGVVSARKREVTLPKYAVMLGTGVACLVLWYWLPVVWVGGFLVPFSGAALINFYVHKNRKRAEPSAAPNGGPATQLGNSGVTEGRHR